MKKPAPQKKSSAKKPAPAKKASAKKAAPPKKAAAAKKAPAKKPPVKAPAKKPAPAPAATAPQVFRVRVSCADGPWWDGEECVRFIEMAEHSNLYDLHVAIQAAVDFDEEGPFYFFLAEDCDTEEREMLPPSLPLDPAKEEIDDDVYEEVEVLPNLPRTGLRRLFYAFKSEDGDWFFEVRHTGVSAAAKPGEFYPLPVESLSVGPNPTEYGHDFDDYAEDPDAFRPPDRGGAPDDDEENPYGDGDDGDGDGDDGDGDDGDGGDDGFGGGDDGGDW